jgi:DNA-binding protein
LTQDTEENDNTVYIGSKTAMSYVHAVVTQFDEGQETVQARGKAISRAVDVTEFIRNRFVEEAQVENVDIGTDQIDTDEGDELNVSSIQIDLTK